MAARRPSAGRRGAQRLSQAVAPTGMKASGCVTIGDGAGPAAAAGDTAGVSTPSVRLRSTVLWTSDPSSLARFYERLLGWERVQDEADWVKLVGPGGQALAFQLEPDHVPPDWPPRTGAQQMMVHLDFTVDDLAAASAHARAVGAVLARQQSDPDVLVHLDPAGHPFCLVAEQ